MSGASKAAQIFVVKYAKQHPTRKQTRTKKDDIPIQNLPTQVRLRIESVYPQGQKVYEQLALRALESELNKNLFRLVSDIIVNILPILDERSQL